MNPDNPLFVSQPLKLSDIVIKLLPTNRTIIIQKQPISNTNITETMITVRRKIYGCFKTNTTLLIRHIGLLLPLHIFK